MNPETLAAALLAVVTPIAEERRPGEPLGLTAADIALERPRNRDHGDWASNIAMKLAKAVGANPRELASDIADGLAEVDGVASVEVAGPGFINIRLDAAAAGALAKKIVDAGAAFGTNDSQRGASINLEFVSANPTGPLHIGHTRWAALGDSIARVLAGERRDARRASSTSTTPAPRWSGSADPCWRRATGSRPPRTATPARTSTTSPSACSRRARPADAPGRRAARGRARPRVRAPARRDPQESLREVQRALRRLVLASARCTPGSNGEPQPRRRGGRPPARAGARVRRGRRRLGAHDRLRR